MNDKQKLKKKRLTGLFRKENEFGVYWSGRLEDGTVLIVSPPHPDAERNDKTPEFILSALVPDTGEPA